MISDFKSFISRNVTNLQGWKTRRKILVIESDDWGSIRMPNNGVKNQFESLGYNLGTNPYCKFDTIANSDDLSALFDVLASFKDVNGNHLKLTFNTVVANPNFENIKKSNFQEYHLEDFRVTLNSYYPNEDVLSLWKEGIEQKLIKPQYHGREHVNVPLWLCELRKKNKPIVDAFKLGFWALPKELYKPIYLDLQQSYASMKPEDIDFYENSIKEGLQIFENIFHFKSDTFIANNYTWPSSLNAILKEQGILGLQSLKYHLEPSVNLGEKRTKIPVFTGKFNENNQTYLVRNCFFEPSSMNHGVDSVSNCINEISQAFIFNKPAIISSHRLNYIGALDEKNRTRNLEGIKSLIIKVQQKWPEIEFMTSDELCNLIINERQQKK